MLELKRAQVIGRATYERWLGTEPHEIDAAAEALREFESRHALLSDLDDQGASCAAAEGLSREPLSAVARSAA